MIARAVPSPEHRRANAPARRSARARARGFTLPELMVSLLAGLIITLAVVGLAKTATNTFYEQARTTAAEMSLRIASQRLASDLSRAGFMSTGNIRWDPTIARRKETPDPASNSGSRYTTLNNLSSLRFYKSGSTEAGSLSLETDNGLKPQAIDIAGNFTSNDQYLGTIGPGTGCGPQRMTLNGDDPAVLKMILTADGKTALSDAAATTIVQSVFLPVSGKTFPARVTDTSGKSHFVVVCAAAVSSGQAYVEFSAATAGSPVLTATETAQQGGVEGFEQLQIAPVQVVRWSIQRRANTRLDPEADAAAKFDLFRTMLDATGAAAGDPELIAEYVVDLRFAVTYDQSPLAPALVSTDFEDESWIWGGVSGLSTSLGPQRVRTVRFRLATRAAVPDRTADMAGPATGYLHRYCIDGAPTDCKRFARVRTIVSEAALMNQARMTY